MTDLYLTMASMYYQDAWGAAVERLVLTRIWYDAEKTKSRKLDGPYQRRFAAYNKDYQRERARKKRATDPEWVARKRATDMASYYRRKNARLASGAG